MLYIFKGPVPLNLIAGDIQSAIEGQIGQTEHRLTIQERREGRYRLVIVGDRVVSESKEPGLHAVRINPQLVKDDGTRVTLTDFPDGFSFGNGVTCNSTVRFRDGTTRVLSWCVLTSAAAALVEADAARYDALRQVVEG